VSAIVKDIETKNGDLMMMVHMNTNFETRLKNLVECHDDDDDDDY
jgi:hypothetical protein